MLVWTPDAGDLSEWIHQWEQLVFGSGVNGYRYRESVEDYYREKVHQRELAGIEEATEILTRFAGTDVRAFAGFGELSFGGGLGERGGYYAVEVIHTGEA